MAKISSFRKAEPSSKSDHASIEGGVAVVQLIEELAKGVFFQGSDLLVERCIFKVKLGLR